MRYELYVERVSERRRRRVQSVSTGRLGLGSHQVHGGSSSAFFTTLSFSLVFNHATLRDDVSLCVDVRVRVRLRRWVGSDSALHKRGASANPRILSACPSAVRTSHDPLVPVRGRHPELDLPILPSRLLEQVNRTLPEQAHVRQAVGTQKAQPPPAGHSGGASGSSAAATRSGGRLEGGQGGKQLGVGEARPEVREGGVVRQDLRRAGDGRTET